MGKKIEEDGQNTEQHQFEKDLEIFLSDLSASKDTFPILISALLSNYRSTQKEYIKKLEELGTKKKKKGKTVYVVSPKDNPEIEKVDRERKKLARMIHLEPRNQVVSLVSLYDSYLGKFVKALLKHKPEILFRTDKKLNYSEILNLKDYENVQDFILEQEIDSLLRKSHTDQFKWLEEKFSTKLAEDLEIWPEFIEITERRNLFVHTDGKVTRQYLNICQKNKCVLGEIKLGDQLEAMDGYVIRANRVFFEMAVKLTQVLWRKLLPDELEAADIKLIEISFELLLDENYKLAQNILDFSVITLKKHFADSFKKTLIINRAAAYKFDDNNKMAQDILSEVDWSACEDIFKLGLTVLKDQFEEAGLIMASISTKKLDKEEYKNWPLFKEFRKTPQFKEAYKSLFDTDFENAQSEDILEPTKLEDSKQ